LGTAVFRENAIEHTAQSRAVRLKQHRRTRRERGPAHQLFLCKRRNMRRAEQYHLYRRGKRKLRDRRQHRNSQFIQQLDRARLGKKFRQRFRTSKRREWERGMYGQIRPAACMRHRWKMAGKRELSVKHRCIKLCNLSPATD
jgi:hypothetical protein